MINTVLYLFVEVEVLLALALRLEGGVVEGQYVPKPARTSTQRTQCKIIDLNYQGRIFGYPRRVPDSQKKKTS